MSSHFISRHQQCRAWFPVASHAIILVCLFSVISLAGGRALAQQHEPSQPAQKPHATEPEAQPNSRGAQTQAHTSEGASAEEPHEEGLLPTIAKLFNFAVLAGILVYFLRSPIAGYLESRATHIRQDLVTAAQMREAATAQLAEIERKLQSLPAELDALKTRGAEDVRAEKVRIAETAASERDRLIEQTRREIQTRLSIARRELVEHAADLAVGVARERIVRSITPDDQLRILDRYTSQLKEAR